MMENLIFPRAGLVKDRLRRQRPRPLAFIGGNAIYQFSHDRKIVLYYAHLERYAEDSWPDIGRTRVK